MLSAHSSSRDDMKYHYDIARKYFVEMSSRSESQDSTKAYSMVRALKMVLMVLKKAAIYLRAGFWTRPN